VESHLDIGQKAPVGSRAGDGNLVSRAIRQAAVVTLMRMAADDQIDSSVQAFDDGDDGAGNAFAFVERAALAAAFMQQNDDRFDALPAQFRYELVNAPGLAEKGKAGHAFGANDAAGAAQREPDERDRSA